MSGPAVRCVRLAVQQAPGVPAGQGFTLEGLDAPLVVIHGPNASGKTTTARALLALLDLEGTNWSRQAVVEGSFRQGDTAWILRREFGDLTVLRNGTPASAGELVPADLVRRYLVSLPELYSTDDAVFARAIATAAQGGVDLSALRQEASFRVPPRPRKKLREFQEACRHVDAAVRFQRELLARRQELSELRNQLQKVTQKLTVMTKPVALAAELVESRRKLAQVTRELAGFPAVIGRLRGDELTVLENLDTKIADLERQLTAVRAQLRQAEADLTAANLTDPEQAAADLVTATARLEELREIDRIRAVAEQRVAQAAAAVEVWRQRLGSRADEAILRSLSTGTLPAVDDLHSQVVDLQARRRELVWRRRRLEAEATEDDAAAEADPFALQQGLTALAEWLAAAPAMPPALKMGTVLGVALAAALAIGGWSRSWSLALTAAVLGGLGAWVGLWVLGGRAAKGERASRRDDYRRCGLVEPAAWSPAAVARRAQELAGALVTVEAQQRRRQLLTELAGEEANLAAAEERLRTRRQALEDQLGITLPDTDPWLPMVVDQLRGWQKAAADLAAAEGDLEHSNRRHRELCAMIAELLASHGESGPVDSSATAAQAGEGLRRRLELHRDAARRRDEATRRIAKELEPVLADSRRARRELLAGLDLVEGREGLLREWLPRLPAFREKAAQRDYHEGRVQELTAALADHADLREADAASVERRQAELLQAAEREKELLAEITEIETLVREAKRGHTLTEALAKREDARAALQEERERAALAVAGAELLDWLHQRTLQRSLPAVFRRAEALLADFTAGALALELAPDGATFLARGVDGAPRGLATLSAGERVQLLLAVRLAYLQEHEPAPLPLLLDEVLGTSDEQRAAAIVQAVAAVTRERQVLVFTAQPDEVARWCEGSRQAGLPQPQVIDLASVRHQATAAPAERLRPVVRQRVPSPEPGEDMTAYGNRLGVPRLDPRSATAAAHLFYLLDDPAVLHHLLQLGIDTWGQVETMRKAGRLADEPWYPAAAAAARALTAAVAAWREGRGRPVARDVLKASGAVSDTFLNRVAAQAEAVGGDARQLLAALESGDVRGWRQGKTAELREYLATAGYLDHRPVLDAAALRARVVGAVYRDLQQKRLSQEVVERILAALPAVPPAAAGSSDASDTATGAAAD